MSVREYEQFIGRRSDEARRYHNFRVSGTESVLFGGFKKHESPKTQKPVFTEEEQKIMTSVANILRKPAPKNSANAFLDLRPYEKTIWNAHKYLLRCDKSKVEAIAYKIPRGRFDEYEEIINALFTLASRDNLQFPQNRIIKDAHCLKKKGYKFAEHLGKGFFGSVTLATKNKKEFAIKQIQVRSQDQVDAVLNEIKILKMLKGKGITANLHDYFMCKSYTMGPSIFLVMDHMNMGAAAENQDLMQKKKYKNQLKKKLKQLHDDLNIMHGDLHLGNALFHKHADGTVEVFLSDFGLAKTTKQLLAEEQFDDDYLFQNPQWSHKKVIAAVARNNNLIAF